VRAFVRLIAALRGPERYQPPAPLNLPSRLLKKRKKDSDISQLAQLSFPTARLLQCGCRSPRPSPARGHLPRARHPPAVTFSRAEAPHHMRPNLPDRHCRLHYGCPPRPRSRLPTAILLLHRSLALDLALQCSAVYRVLLKRMLQEYV
jgi:hypothetical protein